MSRPTGAFLRMSKSGRSRPLPDARTCCAETPGSSYARNPEKLLPHARVLSEVFRETGERDAARLQDTSVVGEREGVRHVLLDEEDRDARLPDRGKRGEDLALADHACVLETGRITLT